MINIWLFGLILILIIILGWIIYLFFINGKRFDFNINEFVPLWVILVSFCMVYLIFSLFLNDYILQHGETINICHEYTNKQEIYSLEDNILSGGVNGTFKLGYGAVRSEPDNLYYFVYHETEDGLLCTKYNSEITYLVLDEELNPYIIKKYEYFDVEYKKHF